MSDPEVVDRYDIVELCAGTAAASLLGLGCPTFPASRIGSKSGYAHVILDELGVSPGFVSRALLVEGDPRLARVLRALFDGPGRDALAARIERDARLPAAALWRAAREGSDPSDDLLWIAGARGGIGGHKGGHKLRPSVDGFIPSRDSLAKRVRAFAGSEGRAVVVEADVSDLDPRSIAPTRVYFDPPYLGRQGYSKKLREPAEAICARWADAGHLVVCSEGRPLSGCDRAVEITASRRGQSRRSLTTDASEWLSVYGERNRVRVCK